MRRLILAAMAVHVAAPLTTQNLAIQKLAQAPSVPHSIPLYFEANHGSYAPEVQFVARGRGYQLFLTATGATLALRQGQDFAGSVGMHFVGGSSMSRLAGEEMLATRVHYLRGNSPADWRTGVPTWQQIRQEAVWPGIDVVYYERDGELEYDFEVAAGFDPDQIRLRFDGAEQPVIQQDGSLLLRTSVGDLRQESPVMFQEIDGVRRHVNGKFQLFADGSVGFAIERDGAGYDPSVPLVIDPVLVFASYVGGSGFDVLFDVVATNSHIYVCGYTDSIDLPTTPGVIQPNKAPGYRDALVAKLSADGSQMVWCTYLGGSLSPAPQSYWDDDRAYAIAIAANGDICAGGASGCSDFPITAGAFDTATNQRDGFVTKLSADGSTLLASTFLGGNGYDRVLALALGSNGEVYVTGEAGSNFPLANPIIGTPLTSNAFVAKLTPGLNALVFSTYLHGGSGSSHSGTDIDVDSSGRAYVAGLTTGGAFPTVNALQPTFGGISDAFLVRLDPTGTMIEYGTYLGGSAAEYKQGPSCGVAADDNGRVWVAVTTKSTDYPVSAGAFQANRAAGPYTTNMAITCLDTFAVGSASMLWSTYFGGFGTNQAFDVDVDASGTAYVLGHSDSTSFPLIDPWRTATSHVDMTLAVFDQNGQPVFSTFLGGDNVVPYSSDHRAGLALDPLGNIYLCASIAPGSMGTPGSFGPVGSATGATGLVAKFTRLGSASDWRVRTPCTAVAPPNSLRPITGAVLGSTLSVAVGDPSNVAFLPLTLTAWFLGSAPAGTSSCGIAVPGWGIGNAPGELLVDMSQQLLLLTGSFVAGPQDTAVYSLLLPSQPSLIGSTLFTQGVLIGGVGTPFILTDALDLTLGS